MLQDVRFVKEKADLANIPPEDKQDGMIVQVLRDKTLWELKLGYWLPFGDPEYDMDNIESSIQFLDEGKLNSIEFYQHNHDEQYSSANHTHGGFISQEDLTLHAANSNPEVLHLTREEKELITQEKIASKEERGMMIVGNSLHVNADGVVNTNPDIYNVWENVYQIGEENSGQYKFYVEEDKPYIEGTLSVYVNGSYIPKTGIRDGLRDDLTGLISYFYLEEGSLSIGDTIVARYYTQPTMQFRARSASTGGGRHSETHMPGGEDYIPFVSATNKGGLMSSSHLATLLGKLDAAEVSNTATPNKVLKLNAEGELEAPVKGNADSATKLQVPIEINGVPFDGSEDISIGASTHVGDEPPEILLENSVWICITGEEVATNG